MKRRHVGWCGCSMCVVARRKAERDHERAMRRRGFMRVRHPHVSPTEESAMDWLKRIAGR